jgi:uncharacterized protein YjlB
MKRNVKNIVVLFSSFAITGALIAVTAACSSASSTTTSLSTTATPTTTTTSPAAQRQSYSGTVATVNDDTLTLTTSQGTVNINISSSTTIEKTVNGTGANLGQGDFVTVSGTADNTGSIDATSITVRASGQTFPSTGSTFGNGGGFTVPNSGASGTGTGITVGTIGTINGNSFTITAAQGQVTVDIGSNTVIETTESGSTSDIQKGASLTVVGTTASNGSINATSVTIAAPVVYAVGIFSDNECTDPITSLNWGKLSPGSSTTQTLYLKNLDNQTMTVTATSSIAKTTELTFSNSGPLSMIPGSLGPTVYQLQMTLTASSSAALGNLNFSINFAGGIPVTLTNQISIVSTSAAPSSTTTTTAKATLSSVAITPASPTLGGLGSTQQFVAVGTYSDGSTINITSQVTWSSSNSAVATISKAGLATGVAVGNSDITATMSGITSPPVTLTVITPTLSSVDITPASPSNLTAGFSQNFRVIGTYSDGSTADITAQATWNSSNTAVATISSTGTITGVASGTVNITASLSGITSPQVTLTVVAPIVSSIEVTPVSPANLAVGSTQQFIATANYSDGSTANLTAQVNWASSNAANASISATGLATGEAAGMTNITATLSGITSPAVTLTVVSQ